MLSYTVRMQRVSSSKVKQLKARFHSLLTIATTWTDWWFKGFISYVTKSHLQTQCCFILTSSPAVFRSKSNTRTPRRNRRWTGAVRSATETVCSLPSRQPCYRPAVSVWTRTPLRSPYPALLRPDPLYRWSVARKWWRDSRSPSSLNWWWWWGSPSSEITSVVLKRLTITTILHVQSYYLV